MKTKFSNQNNIYEYKKLAKQIFELFKSSKKLFFLFKRLNAMPPSVIFSFLFFIWIVVHHSYVLFKN